MSAVMPTARRIAEERHRQACLERALTCAFWRAVRNEEPMPVMAALEAAMRALGTLYRQTAAAHGTGSACDCGWQPDPDADLLVLEAMLASAMQPPPAEDLAGMPVAGRA